MALRGPEIPTNHERSALQLATHDNWVVRNDLYPAGKTPIAGMVSKGWIEPTGRSFGSPGISRHTNG